MKPRPRVVRLPLLAQALAGLALALWIAYPNGSDLAQRLAQGQPLRVGYALEAPYAFLDDSGAPRGESIEVLQAALARMGITQVQFIRLDFGSLLAELEQGRIDLIAGGLFITPERAQRVRFTRPTAAVRPALLLRAAAPAAGEPVRVVAIEGSVEAVEPGRYIVGEHRALVLPDARSAMAALRLGEADAIALSAPSLRWMAQNDGADLALRLQLIDIPARGYPAFALLPEEAGFAARLDAALADYLGSPDHLRTVEPYGFLAEDVQAALDWRPPE